MKNWFIALFLVGIVLVSGCAGSPQTPSTEGMFKVLDSSSVQKGMITPDVILPLDQASACIVAKDAANVMGVSGFECSDTQRSDTGDLHVIYMIDMMHTDIAEINEQAMTITFLIS